MASEIPKYMNKKDFAASLELTKSTFERRSIQIDCKLPRGLLCIHAREEWLKKLQDWEHLQLIRPHSKVSEAK
jgi:hypothetical protein